MALVATLAITGAAVAATAAAAASAAGTAHVLGLCTGLFVVRVVGQLVVLARQPGWLPPMSQWNLLPYRILLPIQLVFIAVMTALTVGVGAGGAVADGSRELGLVLVCASLVYWAGMAVRYAVRMARRPSERWFRGAIPIVFYCVLATFLFALGDLYAGW